MDFLHEVFHPRLVAFCAKLGQNASRQGEEAVALSQMVDRGIYATDNRQVRWAGHVKIANRDDPNRYL